MVNFDILLLCGLVKMAHGSEKPLQHY